LDKKYFINQLQQVCIEESVEHDIKLLSSSKPESFNDAELSDLAQLLQKSDPQTKEAIEKLMHFTAKSSVAALLHLIDMIAKLCKRAHPKRDLKDGLYQFGVISLVDI